MFWRQLLWHEWSFESIIQTDNPVVARHCNQENCLTLCTWNDAKQYRMGGVVYTTLLTLVIVLYQVLKNTKVMIEDKSSGVSDKRVGCYYGVISSIENACFHRFNIPSKQGTLRTISGEPQPLWRTWIPAHEKREENFAYHRSVITLPTPLWLCRQRCWCIMYVSTFFRIKINCAIPFNL